MTGEITLHGLVLPVGGVKDKVLAAHRLGLDTVVLPQRNKPELDKLPDEVRNSMRFVLAKTVDDVLQAALEGPKSQIGLAPRPYVQHTELSTAMPDAGGWYPAHPL
jgi:ATP-dependent Lon protease